ncbi:hypothetical protein JCM10449v2_001288 [Rhodotorula kratochvilovae]
MDESPLVFVERWTGQLRALQGSLQSMAANAPIATEDVQRLSKELTARAGELPAFELSRCERELKALQDTLAASKSASAPKAKFSFKRSAPASSTSSTASSRTATPVPPPPSTPALSQPSRIPAPSVPPTALSLSALSSSFLTPSSLPAPPTAGEALALTALTSCLVDLRDLPAPGPGALYLSKLRACVVLLPREGGSALLSECEGCVIALGAHQFRMHDSTGCAVLLRAGSTPVIERCRRVRFGAYPAVALSPGDEQAEKDTKPVHVQDFDDPFASPERPSANWRLLSSEEQEAVTRALAGVPSEGGEGWEWARDEVLRVLQLSEAGGGEA